MDVTGIGDVAALLKDGLDRLFPNKNDPAYIQAQAALVTAQSAGTLKQMDDNFQSAIEQIKVNAAEAAQPGLHFRDGAGWVCVAGLAVTIFKPLIEWGTALAGHPITLPPVDSTTTNDILMGLLGLGGMHLYQQVKK